MRHRLGSHDSLTARESRQLRRLTTWNSPGILSVIDWILMQFRQVSILMDCDD